MFDAAMSMRSPVRALRPRRAKRDLVEKVPNPAIRAVSPRASASAMVENTAVSASALDSDDLVATRAARSASFTRVPLRKFVRSSVSRYRTSSGRAPLPDPRTLGRASRRARATRTEFLARLPTSGCASRGVKTSPGAGREMTMVRPGARSTLVVGRPAWRHDGGGGWAEAGETDGSPAGPPRPRPTSRSTNASGSSFVQATASAGPATTPD